MILALVGSGEYLPTIEPVDRYLFELMGKSPRVACLPTAAGAEGAERVAYWSNLGVEHFSRMGVPVEALPVIDRASAEAPHQADGVRRANFIYLSGGNPYYLYKTLLDSPVWQAILEVLDQGGVLAGCSAGAMVLGERMPRFPGWMVAFNLLQRAVVVPHFDEVPERVVGAARFLVARNLTLVGVEGSTALIKTDGRQEVAGLGGVTIWDHAQKRRYTHGQTINNRG
jgi:cyanophycinase